MVDSNCKGASVPDYNKSEGAKLSSFVINQRSGASKCRKTWNTTSHFDSQPLVNLVNYQSNFREEACSFCLSVCSMLLPFPDEKLYLDCSKSSYVSFRVGTEILSEDTNIILHLKNCLHYLKIFQYVRRRWNDWWLIKKLQLLINKFLYLIVNF